MQKLGAEQEASFPFVQSFWEALLYVSTQGTKGCLGIKEEKTLSYKSMTSFCQDDAETLLKEPTAKKRDTRQAPLTAEPHENSSYGRAWAYTGRKVCVTFAETGFDGFILPKCLPRYSNRWLWEAQRLFSIPGG